MFTCDIRKVSGGYIVRFGQTIKIGPIDKPGPFRITGYKGPTEMICITMADVLVEIAKASGEFPCPAGSEIRVNVDITEKKEK